MNLSPMNMQYEELVLKSAHMLVFGLGWADYIFRWRISLCVLVGSDRQRVMPVYLSVRSAGLSISAGHYLV